VTRLEEAVLLEVQASLRLFGGESRLLRQLMAEVRALGVARIGVAPTALAALALARSLRPDQALARRCGPQALARVLDALPLHTLSEVACHADVLQRLGCQTLGQVRALPRAGLSRRFGAGPGRALDQALGRLPLVLAWESLPEQFEQSLECAGPIEVSAGLLFGARRLLRQLALWLGARHSGVSAVVLKWQYDARRGCEPAGSLTVRTASPTRDVSHLERLLAEHLGRITLAAPVQALSLQALDVQIWGPDSLSLLPQDQAGGEPLAQCLERIAARLGAEQVLAGALHADHRPQHMQRWRSAVSPPTPVHQAGVQEVAVLPVMAAWQPAWVLAQPLALPMRGERPHYLGPLALLAGPERIEAGWWDGQPAQAADLTLRDYFIARSPQAGLLWVYRLRPHSSQLSGAERWFLHGVFG
jgi:protein ImuB